MAKGTKPFTRRLIQLYSALLYNAHLKGFAEEYLPAVGGGIIDVPEPIIVEDGEE